MMTLRSSSPLLVAGAAALTLLILSAGIAQADQARRLQQPTTPTTRPTGTTPTTGPMMPGTSPGMTATGAGATGNTPSNAATLLLQFDNKANSIQGRNQQKILQTLATGVFKVPVAQVKAQGVVDQSSLGGLLGKQATASYRATGPTTNGKSVLQNCQDNTQGGLFRASAAYRAIKSVTDTWWPGDSVEIQQAKCTQG